MPNLNELISNTDIYFKKHWDETKNEKLPCWSDKWFFCGTIPNNEKQGCYALLNSQNEVVYIGVGAGKGQERYKNAGLGNRLHKYWRKSSNAPDNINGKKNYEPANGWKSIESIVTIGFNNEDSYLTYALEIFLIRRMNPVYNKTHK